jgi:pimeloyl-ACP methyl ester carboxylesterase
LIASLSLLFCLWLLTFSGRLLLFLLSLVWPADLPSPMVLLSARPLVRRTDIPSPSGRRLLVDTYFPRAPGRRGAGGGQYPGVLLLSPASRDGLANPALKRLADGLARLGYVVMLPFPGGEAIPHISGADIADARGALTHFLEIPELDASRSLGVGMSYGSGPLLLAVAELSPLKRPSRLMTLGGYADLREFLRFATTGSFASGAYRGQRTPDPYVRDVLGQSLLAWADAGDRPLLRPVVESHLTSQPPDLSPAGQQLAALFLNRDAKRFDALYAALPPSVRSNIEAMSLPGRLGGVKAPVYVLHPADDDYVPPSEARRLWEALPQAARGELLLLPSLGHDLPGREQMRRQPVALLKTLWRTYRFLNRVLYIARA